MQDFLEDIEITSSAANTSGIKTKNMTSTAPVQNQGGASHAILSVDDQGNIVIAGLDETNWNNIYKQDGTLAGDRTMGMGGNNLTFDGSEIDTKIYSSGRVGINTITDPVDILEISRGGIALQRVGTGPEPVYNNTVYDDRAFIRYYIRSGLFIRKLDIGGFARVTGATGGSEVRLFTNYTPDIEAMCRLRIHREGSVLIAKDAKTLTPFTPSSNETALKVEDGVTTLKNEGVDGDEILCIVDGLRDWSIFQGVNNISVDGVTNKTGILRKPRVTNALYAFQKQDGSNLFSLLSDGANSLISMQVGIAKTVTTITANYTILGTDVNVLVDTTAGNITVTLPNANLYVGREVVIKKITDDTNFMILASAGGTIDGLSNGDAGLNFGGSGNRESIKVVSDGTNRHIIT